MTILNCKNINKDFGDQSILKNLNFEVTYGERIGIVGENGAGKSTLMQIIIGQKKADSGDIKWHDDQCTVGYLGQNGDIELLNAADVDLDHHYYALESKLNIDLADDHAISGGERTKIALAKLWATSPNMLILDEPTNHLDFHGIDWLINEIQYYHGTLIIISHDRYFLDLVCTKIVEIEDGQANDYDGNYSQYLALKTEKRKAAYSAYQAQEAYKKQIHDDIKTLKTWSGKAHRDSTKKQVAGEGKKEYFRMKAKKKDKQVKSRIKRLEKLDIEGLEKPKTEREIVMHFKVTANRGKNIIEAKAISKSFESKQLFQASDFYLTRGERIGLVGVNGCGKTTLLQIILKNVQLDSGEILMSPTLKTAYMDQYEISVPFQTTIKDYFELYDKASCVDLSNRLHQLGFKSLNLDNRVMTLSLGEQTKLKLLKLLLGTYDLIILDEPTNHLDLKSKETFESALSQYNGTLIMVTHDRYLMQKICTGYLIFDKGKIVRSEDLQ